MELIAIEWRPREAPLPPIGALAEGAEAKALARRLLAAPPDAPGDDDPPAPLLGIAAPGLLIILGDARRLPWVDGVRYFGRDPAAPALLLPTNLTPSVPLPLLERAVLARLEGRLPPILLTPSPLRIIPAGHAQPILQSSLSAWLEAS